MHQPFGRKRLSQMHADLETTLTMAYSAPRALDPRMFEVDRRYDQRVIRHLGDLPEGAPPAVTSNCRMEYW